jgi:hypothetical protein
VWLLGVIYVLRVKAQDLRIGRRRRFMRRVLLEDAALESLACSSPQEVWWSLSGVLSSARLVVCSSPSALLVWSFLELPLLQSVGGDVRLQLTSSKFFLGVVQRLLARPSSRLSSGPTTLTAQCVIFLTGVVSLVAEIAALDSGGSLFGRLSFVCVCVCVQFYLVSWVQHLVSLSPLLALLI